mmetsp:Transcript_30566/g.99704  ORF Transcript_30566/g.99704 Transcript_30566/m.99704 type:complete len:228 (-) Transcript_30566:801-1484(-)
MDLQHDGARVRVFTHVDDVLVLLEAGLLRPRACGDAVVARRRPAALAASPTSGAVAVGCAVKGARSSARQYSGRPPSVPVAEGAAVGLEGGADVQLARGEATGRGGRGDGACKTRLVAIRAAGEKVLLCPRVHHLREHKIRPRLFVPQGLAEALAEIPRRDSVEIWSGFGQDSVEIRSGFGRVCHRLVDLSPRGRRAARGARRQCRSGRRRGARRGRRGSGRLARRA